MGTIQPIQMKKETFRGAGTFFLRIFAVLLVVAGIFILLAEIDTRPGTLLVGLTIKAVGIVGLFTGMAIYPQQTKIQ